MKRKRSGQLTKQLRTSRIVLFVRQRGLCFYCLRLCKLPELGTHLKLGPQYQAPELATVEHLVPVKHGGCNHRRNLVMACFECNQHAGSYRPRNLNSPVQMSSIQA